MEFTAGADVDVLPALDASIARLGPNSNRAAPRLRDSPRSAAKSGFMPTVRNTSAESANSCTEQESSSKVSATEDWPASTLIH